jgi:chaperonin GroES
MPKKKIEKVVKKLEKKEKFIIPLHDRVLVRPLTDKELEKKTDFGIILPDTMDEEKIKDQGVVVAVGEGKYDDGKLSPMTVKAGDWVMFSKYGFDEITINDEDYFILKEDNILAIIK